MVRTIKSYKSIVLALAIYLVLYLRCFLEGLIGPYVNNNLELTVVFKTLLAVLLYLGVAMLGLALFRTVKSSIVLEIIVIDVPAIILSCVYLFYLLTIESSFISTLAVYAQQCLFVGLFLVAVEIYRYLAYSQAQKARE